MIDRRYHRSLQVFSWVACGAMTAKLVLFTDYGSRRGHGREQEHVFSGVHEAVVMASLQQTQRLTSGV